MKKNPIEVLANCLQLAHDAIAALPKTRQDAFRPKLLDLNEDHRSLLVRGSGSHWKEYRERQCFHVEIGGAGENDTPYREYVVKGIEAMAKELGWKISTLRSRLSMSKGSFTMIREPYERSNKDGTWDRTHTTREKISITRLPLNP